MLHMTVWVWSICTAVEYSIWPLCMMWKHEAEVSDLGVCSSGLSTMLTKLALA